MKRVGSGPYPMREHKAGMAIAPVKTRFFSTLTSMVGPCYALAGLHGQLLASEAKPSLSSLIVEQGLNQILFPEIGP